MDIWVGAAGHGWVSVSFGFLMWGWLGWEWPLWPEGWKDDGMGRRNARAGSLGMLVFSRVLQVNEVESHCAEDNKVFVPGLARSLFTRV